MQATCLCFKKALIEKIHTLNPILYQVHKYCRRAVLANLHHRPLKFGRLIVHKKHTYCYKKFCSHGNSLFSSPHPLDFKMLAISSLKNIKQDHKVKLAFLYACWIMQMRLHLQIWKWRSKVARNALNIEVVWNGNKTVKLVLWSTFSRIVLQRIKHFWHELAEVSFFILFDQTFYECMTSSLC